MTLLPINQDSLVASVRDILNQYIGKKGYEVSFNILDSLTKMIIGADMLLATRGQKISKAEYDERIFGWLNLSCGNGLKQRIHLLILPHAFIGMEYFQNQ